MSKRVFDQYIYSRSLIQQQANQKQALHSQITQEDATLSRERESQLTSDNEDNRNPNRLGTLKINVQSAPEYKYSPNHSFTISGEVYMLQRRPEHPHIIINNQYQGIQVLHPWHGTQVLQVDFTQGYDSYGIINSWCFRSDGKAVLVLNEQSCTACLLFLSKENANACYDLESPRMQKVTDLRYIWEGDSFWLTGGKSLAYYNLQWQDGLPVLVSRGSIHARIAHKKWCQIVSKLDTWQDQVLRVEPDLSQIIYYSASEQPEIKVSNWHQETIWSAIAPEYVSVMAFHNELVFMMYEHEVHAINKQGQVETIYSVPDGFYCGGIDTLPAIDNYPASLILACSSWNEPKQTQILVYQLDN